MEVLPWDCLIAWIEGAWGNEVGMTELMAF